MSDAAPYLSIVLTGRNDAHGTDFTARFIRTLRFNHRQLAAAGIAHEFVFVEWNPVPDAPWLADVACAEVPEVRGCFRTYLVDPRYQEALALNPRLRFLEFPAKNVGIRRARGEFVLTTNCDIYLGREVLAHVAVGRLQPQVVYRARRVDLKVGTDQSVVDWSVLEDLRNHASRRKALSPPLYSGGTGDFLLLDREGYLRLGGFNEVYRVARILLDHNFLVKAYSNGHPIVDIGGPVYHVNHAGSFRLAKREYAGREQEAPWGDARWPAGWVTYANPDGWGLASAPERDAGAGRTWLEFAWDAVPPLVDLRRVVLPPARAGQPDARSAR